ncbi:MAG: hypothetical protein RJA57_894 [Bacteroidota bacterium]|jgi:predicted transcriptional regulator
MSKPAFIKPTDGEWEILQVLWELEQATVRDVHQKLAASRKTGYTTTLKLMQIMQEKGLVRRDVSARSHVYRAAVKRKETEQLIIRDLIDRYFNGSTPRLIIRTLSGNNENFSEKEWRKIQAAIESRKNED